MNILIQTQTLPKAGSSAAENEDALAFSTETARVALCDGASEGWGSGAWARHLAHSLVNLPATPSSYQAWLNDTRQSAVFTAAPVVAWYAQEKQAQGAFSTLLSVSFSQASDGTPRFHAVAVGDTALFQLRDNKLIARFPIEKSSEFDNRPKLVASAAEMAQVEPEWFAGKAEAGDRFYLLTDALAEWFLRTAEAGEEPWSSLDAVTSAADPAAEFARWVQSLREAKRIRNDDSSLVAVRVE